MKKKITVSIFSILILVTFSQIIVPVCAINGWSEPVQVTYNTEEVTGPSISGDSSKIVMRYQSAIGVVDDIYVVNSDGTNFIPVSPNYYLFETLYPSISDDGSKVAYDAMTDDVWQVFVVNSDGTEFEIITNMEDDVGWEMISGDGNKIAFVSGGEIFVINYDGTGLTQVTTDIGGAPSISDDGTKIAFSHDGDIFVVNADGTGIEQLTTLGDVHYPSISGDGNRIVFISGGEVFVVNFDGTGLSQITNTGAGAFPSISDDGEVIAFSHDGEIFVVNADGTGLTQVTSFGRLGAGHPSISDDGNTIAFEAYAHYDPPGYYDDDIFVVKRCPPFVVPEVPVGTILAVTSMIIALMFYTIYKRKKTK